MAFTLCCLCLNQFSGPPLDVDPLLGIGLIFFKKEIIILAKSLFVFGLRPSTW